MFIKDLVRTKALDDLFTAMNHDVALARYELHRLVSSVHSSFKSSCTVEKPSCHEFPYQPLGHCHLLRLGVPNYEVNMRLEGHLSRAHQ